MNNKNTKGKQVKFSYLPSASSVKCLNRRENDQVQADLLDVFLDRDMVAWMVLATHSHC